MKVKSHIWRGVTTLTASFLTVSLSATMVIGGFRTDIDKFLGTQSSKILTEGASAEELYTYASDYKSTTELLDAIEDLGERMNEEGSVLLKNNGALPLSEAETKKVSLLGFSSYYPVQGGDFASTLSVNTGTDADTVDMVTAFASKGFVINPVQIRSHPSVGKDHVLPDDCAFHDGNLYQPGSRRGGHGQRRSGMEGQPFRL